MLFLDTHIWIWWAEQDVRKLSKPIHRLIADSTEELFISSLSIYELNQLVRRRRVDLRLPLAEWIKHATTESAIAPIPVCAQIADRAGSLSDHHGDPIDRLIIATALHSGTRLLSADSRFPLYRELDGILVQ